MITSREGHQFLRLMIKEEREAEVEIENAG